MDDKRNVARPARTAQSVGDYDRLNPQAIASRRQLYAKSAVVGRMANESMPQTFREALTEAAAALTPEDMLDASQNTSLNLQRMTAAQNVMASRPDNMVALQPAIIGYAAHIANQVHQESEVGVHHPWRQSFGDRFHERDEQEGFVRIPPVNEIRGGPSVL